MKSTQTQTSWFVVALMVLCFGAGIAGAGDLETKTVRLAFKDVPLRQAVRELADQGGYTAKLEASAIPDGLKKVTLVTDDPIPLKTALDLVTTYAGLHYIVRGDDVIVFKTLDKAPAPAHQAAKGDAIEWVARSYDVRELVYPKANARSPFRRHRIGSYLNTGGHPTYIDTFWNDYAITLNYGEVVSYEDLYHGLNEDEYEAAILLNKARSLVFNIMNTINPGMWAPPLIFEPVTELVAPEYSGIPTEQAVERALQAGKSGIIIYRDGVLTVLVKKGTPLKTRYMGLANKDRLTTAGGVGIGVKVTPRGYLSIASVSKGQPAALAGLKAGDIIVAVDGRSISGMTLNQVAASIQGEIGTKVKIDVLRTNPLQRKTFEVLRVPMTE